MGILVLNAGSSTLKFAVFQGSELEECARGLVEWPDPEGAQLSWHCSQGEVGKRALAQRDPASLVNEIHTLLTDRAIGQPIQAIGHRVVHGGTEFRQPTIIDQRLLQHLSQLSALAPLHNPPALETIRATLSALPSVRQVAVFDTAFFADLPARAHVYPVPYEWYERYGIRRFGFHGISHAYCAKRATEMLGRVGDETLRTIVCHLGNGCSATALVGERPIATTMGFTPLDGLMMGTRSGAIDPGILLHLLEHHNMDPRELHEALNSRSGLAGVSGISPDFRKVTQAAEKGNARAQLAIDLFADHVRSAIGALAVTLGGIDALVFTAGIGEHSASLRRQVCQGLACLGIDLDEAKNQVCGEDRDLSGLRSRGRVLVIRTKEERMIAIEAVRS